MKVRCEGLGLRKLGISRVRFANRDFMIPASRRRWRFGGGRPVVATNG